jgi:hypothetical protein
MQRKTMQYRSAWSVLNHIVIHQGPGLKGAVPVQRLRKDGFVSNEAWIRTLSWEGAVGYRLKIYLGDEI